MTRNATAALALLTLLIGTSPRSATAESPQPTPTPAEAAKVKKKLGGGSFGIPPKPTPGAGAGSLADIARKAQEEDAAATRPGRRIVITNESLRRSEPAPGSSAITITGSADKKPVARTRPTATPSEIPEYRDASGRTEAEWRRRAEEVRSRAAEVEAEITAARAEVRRLENDFYAWSDGNYRERVIRPAWDQARQKLKDLEVAADEARSAVDGLEEEARKSGTPPGWLR
jgi:Asp-tRNA(Asn)/Glu-tRNA(Gln) amidotransferase A subunit family amidase